LAGELLVFPLRSRVLRSALRDSMDDPDLAVELYARWYEALTGRQLHRRARLAAARRLDRLSRQGSSPGAM
jgi:hypothetical protein